MSNHVGCVLHYLHNTPDIFQIQTGPTRHKEILLNYLTNKQGLFDRLFPYYTSKLCVSYAEERRNLQAMCFLW